MQSQQLPEFAGFWTDQNFVGSNKSVEISRPMFEIKPLTKSSVADNGDYDPFEKISSRSSYSRNLPPVAESWKKPSPAPVISVPGDNVPDSETQIHSLSNTGQECLLSQGRGKNSAKVHSVDSFQWQQSSKGSQYRQGSMNLDTIIRLGDRNGVLHSRSTSRRHSTRCMCQGPLLDETIKNNLPHLLPQPPQSDGNRHVTTVGRLTLKQEFYGGNTCRVTQLALGDPTPESAPTLSLLRKDLVHGGSSRTTRPCEEQEMNVARAPSSLPTSPCSGTKESHASRLLKKCKPSGLAQRVDDEIAKNQVKSDNFTMLEGPEKLSKQKDPNVLETFAVPPQQRIGNSVEPCNLRISNGSVIDQDCRRISNMCRGDSVRTNRAQASLTTAQPECSNVGSNNTGGPENGSYPTVQTLEGYAAVNKQATQRSRSPWLSKWKRKSDPTTEIALAIVDDEARQNLKATHAHSPIAKTSQTLRDVRKTSNTTSDRYSSRMIGRERSPSSRSRHRRSTSWSCASHACTAALSPRLRVVQGSRVQDKFGETDSFRVNSKNFAKSTISSVECDGSQQFGNRHDSSRMRKSLGSLRAAREMSFRKGDVLEDCPGSFGSIDNPGSHCWSFRSFDGVSTNQLYARNRFLSVEEAEWDRLIPPPLQGDQSRRIADIAVLCNSSLNFIFKCREIQHLNRFLRRQKKCLLRALEKGNTDYFNVVLSGTNIDASSMVTTICYAWFLENKALKMEEEPCRAVAVIEIPRHQMHKHKDAALLFDACGIDAEALLYANEIEMLSLIKAGRVKISAIEDVLVTSDKVGSLCTVLGEKLQAEAPYLLEPRYMKTLLLAGILLDTENLNFASLRDTEIATSLLVGSGSLGRNGFYEQLRGTEHDDRILDLIARYYGDDKQRSSEKTFSMTKSSLQQETEQARSEQDSLSNQSQDQTSTSEVRTSFSGLDEDPSRSKQHSSKHSKPIPHTAPAATHYLRTIFDMGCVEDKANMWKSANPCKDSDPQASLERFTSHRRVRSMPYVYRA